MRFTFEVTVEVERLEGKFASRDEIEQYLFDEIEGAAPSEVSGVGADGDSTYEVTSFVVDPKGK
jgi:hypothetical protein